MKYGYATAIDTKELNAAAATAARIVRLVLILLVFPHRLFAQIVEPEFDFLLARLAPVCQLVYLADARAVVLLAGHPPGEFLRLEADEIAIHQEQALQRNGGGESFFRADIRAREVE